MCQKTHHSFNSKMWVFLAWNFSLFLSFFKKVSRDRRWAKKVGYRQLSYARLVSCIGQSCQWPQCSAVCVTKHPPFLSMSGRDILATSHQPTKKRALFQNDFATLDTTKHHQRGHLSSPRKDLEQLETLRTLLRTQLHYIELYHFLQCQCW